MTRKLARVAVAATAFGSATLAVAPPAQAQAEGVRCGLTSAADPTAEADIYTGELHGGPLTVTADPTASITLKCTVQVGATGQVHAGPDAASASASGTGTAVLPPTAVSYAAPPSADVYLCTEVNVNGVTYYYDEANGIWSQSSSASCVLAISQEGICFRSYHQGELVVWDTGWACVEVKVEPA